MEFKTRQELYKYIFDNWLECYWSDLGENKIYVRDTKTKTNKRILLLRNANEE